MSENLTRSDMPLAQIIEELRIRANPGESGTRNDYQQLLHDAAWHLAVHKSDRELYLLITPEEAREWEADEIDAKRYRFLREECGNGTHTEPYVCGVHGAPFGDDGWLTGELLDKAVDSHRKG